MNIYGHQVLKMFKEEAPMFASSLKVYIFLLKMLMFLKLLLPAYRTQFQVKRTL